MSLREYNRKRKFDQTPEPRGRKAKAAKQLRFVVQMHDASRLHWDFRLEFDGVFKSWAVPKGPSLNPLDQRLAVHVEDHPLDYGSFEGIIPKGNYGAGTVVIWDEGTYVERSSGDPKSSDAAMTKNIDKGHLTFILHGHKLNGEFALIQLKKDASKKNWLLVKARDDYSTYKRSEIPGNESVVSGRTVEQIAKHAEKEGAVWLPKKGRLKPAPKREIKPPPPPKKKLALKTHEPLVKAKATGAKKAPLPRKIKPMIATRSRKEAPKGWIKEPHLDGLRAISEVEGKKVSLYSRAGLPFGKKHPKIVHDLEALGVRAIFDGEIVGDKYYVYDLLYWDDKDLRDEKLAKRKAALKSAFKNSKHVVHLDAHKKAGAQVAKDPDSPYTSGTNSEWIITGEPSKPRASATVTDEPILTNLDKIYFPKDKITKGDLIAYYDSVADYILPYLKDRPESMNRQPNGIDKPGFFQKDLTGHIPRFVKTERIFSESADKSIDYLLCQDKRTLLYMANLGCIELNPWFSRIGHLDKPDFLVIDLDPDDNSFEEVMDIAKQFHTILIEVGAKNFVKTSGATGIHIGVPLQAKYDFDTAREFAETICRAVARENPANTSVERTPARRRKKIYLDFLQNRRGQTLAAPLCVRPKPGAPVSMPLEWSELKKGLRPEQFNIRNALRRIAKFDDPWKPVLGPSVDLTKCSKALHRMYPKD